MANLNRIQQLLDTSEDYQKRFLNDPVAALAQEGLQLSVEMQLDVRQQVRQAQARGAAPPGAAAQKGSVKGRVRKEFILIKLAVVLIGSF